MKERDHIGDAGVGEDKKLKWNLKERDEKTSTEFIWLRIQVRCGSCEHGNESLAFLLSGNFLNS
jgi:hypothetical protein